MAVYKSNSVTFIDQTDSRKLEVYIKSNFPTMQIYNGNSGAHTPDWTQDGGLALAADVYLDSQKISAPYSGVTFKWYRNTEVSGSEISKTNQLNISTNELDSYPIVTYICAISYQNINAMSRITFSRVDTGMNGENGTSVQIKGTATSVEKIQDTDYYTITYDGSDVSSAQLNDSYMYEGDLYVCIDSKDGVDYFVNVGRIQGPKGEDARNIILTGNSQVFKVSKTNVCTPSTISVIATQINTGVVGFSYSVNGGQSFTNTAPMGVVRDGNIITVSGSILTSNSLSIKASDGVYSDVFTIYKAYDGSDGSDGQHSSVALLTNENISLAADTSGKVSTTSFTTNVVAYTGMTKVTPRIGTITNLPSGMTVGQPVEVSGEQVLTFSIADNSTLGAATSNCGTIIIPIIEPINTNLQLNWSKINAGTPGVGVKSSTVTYGVSDSSSTKPTDWQSTTPSVEDGRYLWARTIIDYTDDTIADTVTYTYTKQGTKGDTGESGTSVTVSSVQYQEGTSATTPPAGVWSNTVVSVAEGKYLWTKTTFSDNNVAYGVAKQGSSGVSASIVDITPSALYFKSTTGANGTFDPQYIYLYPRFQNATYSNWQYSVDGGVTWTTVVGANGLTIGTYNSVANSLRIDRTSTLYTSSITSISFKCNSTVSSVYDIVSIAKIYDVVDLQIGGSNLLRGTGDFVIDSTRVNGWNNLTNYIIEHDEDGFAVAIQETVDATNNLHKGIYSSVVKVAQGDKFTVSFWMKVSDISLWDSWVPVILELYNKSLVRVAWKDCQLSTCSIYPSVLKSDVWTYCTLSFEVNNQFSFAENKTWNDVVYFGIRLDLAKNGKIYFKKAQVERGNKATDWAPAPEDIVEESSNVNAILSNEAHFFEATAGGIPTNANITIDVIGYKGSVRSVTTVGTITGTPSAGMTVTITDNGTTNTKLTVSVTQSLTSDVADYGVLNIPITVNGHTINKIFSWTKAKAGDAGSPGDDAVTFQVYSNNGYTLSTSTPNISLQTFAYIGDVEIKAGATYQWYRNNDTDWVAISGATNDNLTVSKDDVSFSNNYMCKMYFGSAEYVGVVTIEDKSDEHKVFASKPSNYFAGDLWVVGTDYIPSGFIVGSMLRAKNNNATYADSDWELATRYDEEIDALKEKVAKQEQNVYLNTENGLRVGDATIQNNVLSIGSVEATTVNAQSANIESPLTVTGRYSGSTMLQAPTINLGNFKLVIESNGSFSIIANT